MNDTMPTPKELAQMLADAERPTLHAAAAERLEGWQACAAHVKRLVPIVQALSPAVDVEAVMKLVERYAISIMLAVEMHNDGNDAESAEVTKEADRRKQKIRAILEGKPCP